MRGGETVAQPLCTPMMIDSFSFYYQISLGLIQTIPALALVCCFIGSLASRLPSLLSVGWSVCLSKFPLRAGIYTSMLLSEHVFVTSIILRKISSLSAIKKQIRVESWNSQGMFLGMEDDDCKRKNWTLGQNGGAAPGPKTCKNYPKLFYFKIPYHNTGLKLRFCSFHPDNWPLFNFLPNYCFTSTRDSAIHSLADQRIKIWLSFSDSRAAQTKLA